MASITSPKVSNGASALRPRASAGLLIKEVAMTSLRHIGHRGRAVLYASLVGAMFVASQASGACSNSTTSAYFSRLVAKTETPKSKFV